MTSGLPNHKFRGLDGDGHLNQAVGLVAAAMLLWGQGIGWGQDL